MQEADVPAPFNAGDHVRLKTGGPRMTVISITPITRLEYVPDLDQRNRQSDRSRVPGVARLRDAASWVGAHKRVPTGHYEVACAWFGTYSTGIPRSEEKRQTWPAEALELAEDGG